MQFRSGIAQELLVSIFQRLVSDDFQLHVYFRDHDAPYLLPELEICIIFQQGKTDWVNNETGRCSFIDDSL